MNLVLIGFKCAGKTSCGELAASKLNKTFVDTDRIVEALYYDPALGRAQRFTCREIVCSHGEAFFRDLERDAVRRARSVKAGIISTGGGTILNFENYLELKKLGTLVYLKTDREVIHDRIMSLPSPPAYLDPHDLEGSFDRMYDARVSSYENIADHILPTHGLTIDEVAEALCQLYQQINKRDLSYG